MSDGPMDAKEIAALHRDIAEKYRKVADSPAGLFRYPTGEASVLGLGYPPPLVAIVPPALRERFVGVGNPFALRQIRTGDSVLDLGCGAGFDAWIAARLVGDTGHVVGIDLSPEMLAHAAAESDKTRVARLAFCLGAVEALPFLDGSFDIALSNGVLNLVPDKPGALREIFRILRPGGRLPACDSGLAGDEPPPDKTPWSD